MNAWVKDRLNAMMGVPLIGMLMGDPATQVQITNALRLEWMADRLNEQERHSSLTFGGNE